MKHKEYEIPPLKQENANEVFLVNFFGEHNNEEIELRKVIFENRFLLHYSLQTLLEKHGDAKWRFGSLDSHIHHGIRMQLHENKYCRIDLGWLDDEGDFHEGRWLKIARAQFIERAQDLQNKFMYVPNENEIIPSFELEPQASAIKGDAA